MHFIDQIDIINNYESRFNSLVLINQLCITYTSLAGLEHMTTGSVVKRLTLLHLINSQRFYNLNNLIIYYMYHPIIVFDISSHRLSLLSLHNYEQVTNCQNTL